MKGFDKKMEKVRAKTMVECERGRLNAGREKAERDNWIGAVLMHGPYDV